MNGEKIGHETTDLPYPSTPVIYVTEPGLYQCIASSRRAGNRVMGKIISLTVDADELILCL